MPFKFPLEAFQCISKGFIRPSKGILKGQLKPFSKASEAPGPLENWTQANVEMSRTRNDYFASKAGLFLS